MADDVPAPDAPPAGGAPSLRWSIRQSLLQYVSSLPDGRLRVAGGVDVVDGFHFVFPAADPAVDGTTAVEGLHRFTGAVELTAHFGMLRFVFADPWLHARPDGAGALSTVTHDGSRATIATCALQRDADGTWQGTRVTLTQDGAALMADTYPAGLELDPFTASAHEPPGRTGHREALDP